MWTLLLLELLAIGFKLFEFILKFTCFASEKHITHPGKVTLKLAKKTLVLKCLPWVGYIFYW